ncbi:unnamed protein product [Clavelina lepadiformis]|uniref:Uncharacterized protein n=1 Tax=Clavelina lepadiformis TaxID=159417 RepID=A0ABP0G0G3_CLALP
MAPAQSSSVSDGDDEDDDDDDATTSSATFRTSRTGCKILPPKRFSDYKHNMFICLLLTCFAYISEVLTTFNEENKFLHCQLTKLIGTLYKAVGKIFPTEILSSTLGHQTMGSSLGDFMSRATCHSINGTVLPSLAYRNAFSQRPLILYRDQNGHSQYGQLISDNIVLPGVHLLESYRPARSFVFRVLGHTVLYHNYTLSHEHVQVHQLNLPLSTIHLNYNAPDYEKILNELPDSDSFTDLQSLLSSMSEANLLKEKMRHVITSLTTTDETMINGSYVADTFAHAAKQTLLPCTVADYESISLSPYIHPATTCHDVGLLQYHRVYPIISAASAVCQISCVPYSRWAQPTASTRWTPTTNSTVAFASTFL